MNMTDRAFDTETLAQSGYTVWGSLHEGAPDWSLVSPKDRETWAHAALVASDLIEHAEGLRFYDLAKAVYAAQTKASDYEQLARLEQLKWEAVARHWTNLVDSDGSVNIPDHEGRWREWLKHKEQQ